MLHTIKILCSVPNSALSIPVVFLWSYKPIWSLNLPLNIQGKIWNIFMHCDFQCSFQLDVLNRYHVILQLFPGELGIIGNLTACITPCIDDGRSFNCFICAKCESSKELSSDGTLVKLRNVWKYARGTFECFWQGRRGKSNVWDLPVRTRALCLRNAVALPPGSHSSKVVFSIVLSN